MNKQIKITFEKVIYIIETCGTAMGVKTCKYNQAKDFINYETFTAEYPLGLEKRRIKTIEELGYKIINRIVEGSEKHNSVRVICVKGNN